MTADNREIVKSAFLWFVALYISERALLFGGTYRLYLQDAEYKERCQCELSAYFCWFLFSSALKMEVVSSF
jgi:hypothetical protein